MYKLPHLILSSSPTVALPDPRWDVYSVAATLAELATGKKPFADTPSAMVAVEHAMGRTLQHMNLDQVPDDKLR